jgi:hypothetical protein
MLYASKMILSYESESTTQPPATSPKFLRCPCLLLYQRPEAFDVTLFASRYLHLTRNRFLEIELCTGWNSVLEGELHVRAATAGLRLQTSEAKMTNTKPEVLKKAEAGVIRFGVLDKESVTKIMLPFTLENEANDISLKLEISYTTEKGTFFLASTPSVSIMLPLGVNVQDVFKHKALFSKFTISSATSSPLRLLKSRLESSDVFEARNGGDLRDPVMIFPQQPASLLYRITPRSTQVSKGNLDGPRKKEKSSLSLVIHYICLKEEIDNAVKSALRAALHETSFYRYLRLVIPIVISQLHLRFTSHNLEKTALTGELTTSILSEINWREFFLGLGQANGQNEDVASAIARWIQEWCQKTPSIPLLPIGTSEVEIANSRSIIIPVDVPSITVVHTADIKIHQNGPTRGDAVVRTHQSIPATLHIKWTRMWDTSPIIEHRSSQAPPETAQTLDFVYEISAPTDTWLIGGKRKGHFRIPSSKSTPQTSALEFPVLLIPVREGYLPYPHLEIKPVPVSASMPLTVDVRGSGGSNNSVPISVNGGVEKAAVTCETDYRNIGETVRVISNARKTTVSLDASGPQGGAWLLESEMRESENERGVFVV